jgi:hypothetical protein
LRKTADRVRERLGRLCDELDRWASLDKIVRDAGAGSELDALLAMIGGGGNADLEQVRVLLDAIEEACKRSGLDGAIRGSRFRPLPKGLSASPVGESWVCPRGCCARVVLAEETDACPVCAVAGGTPMKRFLGRP